MLFNKSKVGTGGLAEIGELGGSKTDVATSGNLLINTIGTSLIANRSLAEAMLRVSPTRAKSKCYHDREKFATVTFGNRAKNCTTETRFGVNQIGASQTTEFFEPF